MNLKKQNQKSSSGKLDSFYQGWRSEVLAEYILSEIAFVVPVQVGSDTGADFFCTLFSKEEQYLEPGKTFSVQVKKRVKEYDITLNTTNINFLASLRIPHYLCIANPEDSSIKMYSCQQLMLLFIKFGNLAKENKTDEKFVIQLKPVERYSKQNLSNIAKLMKKKCFSDLLKDTNISKWNKTKKANQFELEIGPQIFETQVDKLKDNNERKRISDELSEWIKYDYFNIHNFSTCVYSPLLRFFNEDKLTTKMISFTQATPETFVYSYATTRLTILLEYLETMGIRIKDIDNLKKLISLLSEKNKINVMNENDIIPGWTEEWNTRLKNIYLKLSREDEKTMRASISGFPVANRREARKLGLLRKQKFRSRTRAN